MQGLHVDPLVERIMRDISLRPSSFVSLGAEQDATGRDERPPDGLTLAHIDELLRRAAAGAREEERIRAESSVAGACEGAYAEGFRAGVENAVAHLRSVLKVNVGGPTNAARGASGTLAGLIAEYVRPGEPFKDEWCVELRQLAEQVGELCDEALDALESLQPVEPVDPAVAEFHDDHLSF